MLTVPAFGAIPRLTGTARPCRPRTGAIAGAPAIVGPVVSTAARTSVHERPLLISDVVRSHVAGNAGRGFRVEAPTCGLVSGGVLLSHPLSRAVPSALEGLASGFGMGPGVSPPLWPP